MPDFSEQIRLWYHQNHRSLPWRETSDPYLIWVSEVILQQTRVQQGLSYYIRFTEAFPTVQDLAQASEDQILKLWQGLGYYSRARNMHKTAKAVVNEANGVFPTAYEHLIELPGIGPYTAAAVSSFSSNAPHAVVDGNVMRVLSRFLASDLAIDSTQGKKWMQRSAQELMDTSAAAEHNQAIMELGALICTPQPLCERCPVQESCQSLRNGNPTFYPIKNKKSSVRDRYLHYFIFQMGEKILLRKRGTDNIWKGLYEFPLLDSFKPIARATEKKWLKSIQVSPPTKLEPIAKKVHLLSHQRLHICFYLIQVPDGIQVETGEWFTLPKAGQVPVPKPIEPIIELLKAGC